MSVEHIVILSLLGYSVVRELFFHYSTQKLINKIMSRNYQEYKYVDDLSKRSQDQNNFQDREEDIPEDLGSLAGIG